MVMTVSSAAAHMIESYMGIPGEKIRVVHNSSPVLPRPVVDRRPLILTVGHMEEYKNPVGWLEVAELVIRQRPDVGFVWLGEGKLRAQIREDVACRGMAGQVNLPGYTEETASWYDQAQIYFQPSLKESHGIAVLEAMAHGLPCIVSDREGLPESVINGKTGFVCPVENSAMFASCILRLLDESSLRQQMGAEGRLRIFECFSVEVQEKKILSLYDYLQGQA